MTRPVERAPAGQVAPGQLVTDAGDEVGVGVEVTAVQPEGFVATVVLDSEWVAPAGRPGDDYGAKRFAPALRAAELDTAGWVCDQGLASLRIGGSATRRGDLLSAPSPIATVPAMDFKVFTDRNGGWDSYSGEATCSRDRDVLIVEDGGREIIYGPNGWVRVEAAGQVRTLAASCDVELTALPDHHLNVWLDNEPLIVDDPESARRWKRRP